MRLVSFGLVLFALTSMACSGTDGAGLPPATETPTDPNQPNPESPPSPNAAPPNTTNGGGGAGTGKPITIALTSTATTVTSSAPFLLDVAIIDPDNVGLQEVVFRKKGSGFATINGAPWSATTKLVNLDNGLVEYDAHAIDKLGREIDSNKVLINAAIAAPKLTLSANPTNAILPGVVDVNVSTTLPPTDVALIEVKKGNTTFCTTGSPTGCNLPFAVWRSDNGKDVLTAKLVDKDGNVATAKALDVDIKPAAYRDQMSGAKANGATSVVVDASGNVFIVGYTLDDIPGATGTGAVFVRKLDTAGTILWTKRYCTDCQFYSPKAALGANGGLVIASLTGPLGNMNASILRLGADGTQLFRSDVAAPTTGFGEVEGVVEANGSIYMLADSYVGTIAGSTGAGRCVMSSFDAMNGLRNFARRFPCTMGWNNVFGPVWTGDGVVVAYNDSPEPDVWSRPSLHKIDFDGKDPGRVPMDLATASVKSITGSGSEIFVAFDELDYSKEKFIPSARKIARYAMSSLTFTSSFKTDATISALAADGQGGVLGVMGYADGLVHYNASGTKLFTFASTVNQWTAVAGGPNGTSWLVGRATMDWLRPLSNASADAVYISLAANGTPR